MEHLEGERAGACAGLVDLSWRIWRIWRIGNTRVSLGFPQSVHRLSTGFPHAEVHDRAVRGAAVEQRVGREEPARETVVKDALHELGLAPALSGEAVDAGKHPPPVLVGVVEETEEHDAVLGAVDEWKQNEPEVLEREEIHSTLSSRGRGPREDARGPRPRRSARYVMATAARRVW
jgi:hypothetical protein